MANWKVFRLSADAAAAGQRLDQWVSGQTPELSRSLVRKIIDIGGIHLNGRRIRQCSLLVQVDDKVELFLDGKVLKPFFLDEGHIVFRDKYLLAVNKPPGIDTQPTPARFKGTLYQALKSFLQDPSRPHVSPPLGMVQRLDRDTSGVMVFSIHPQAHKPLTAAFSNQEVQKVYLALTSGIPSSEAGEIRSMLARKRSENLVRSVLKGGKQAITRYRVLASGDGAALVAVEIPTGRSHQIRAHFAEAGFPLAGDIKYGGSERIGGIRMPRQMLHARSIKLRHPVSGGSLRLEAPIPGDMLSSLQGLGIPPLELVAGAFA